MPKSTNKEDLSKLQNIMKKKIKKKAQLCCV